MDFDNPEIKRILSKTINTLTLLSRTELIALHQSVPYIRETILPIISDGMKWALTKNLQSLALHSYRILAEVNNIHPSEFFGNASLFHSSLELCQSHRDSDEDLTSLCYEVRSMREYDCAISVFRICHIFPDSLSQLLSIPPLPGIDVNQAKLFVLHACARASESSTVATCRCTLKSTVFPPFFSTFTFRYLALLLLVATLLPLHVVEILPGRVGKPLLSTFHTLAKFYLYILFTPTM